jgi:hypothetical protein
VARTIRQVLDEHTEAWMRLPGVVGTAQGEAEGKPCILVLVTSVTSLLEASIPESVDGHPVCLRKTGAFEAR